MNEMTIGERLRVTRLQRGLDKKRAADQIGVRRSTVLNIERGSNPPSIRTFRKLAAWLGLYDEDILRYIREKHDPTPVADTAADKKV